MIVVYIFVYESNRYCWWGENYSSATHSPNFLMFLLGW